tara:strand:+ start:209 stop:2227 length:2019 start_codon:yes stop_codon:yes gene_type:complete
MIRLIITLCLPVFFIACEPTEEEVLEPLPPMNLPEGCNPLTLNEDCLLPYPSDHFLVPDASMPSGQRVSYSKYAIPYDEGGRDLDATNWREMDGFSLVPSILTEFEETPAYDGLVHILEDYELSLSAETSATLIINVETGATVAHYVDIDSRVPEDEVPMMILHPVENLDSATQYVVGLFGVKNEEGDLVEGPEGFKRLLSGRTESDPDLASKQKFYDDTLFPLFADHGVKKDDLQMAWSFTTGSETRATEDMFRMRTLTMEWLENNSPEIEITSDDVTNREERRTWRVIDGRIQIPLFLKSASPGTELMRNDDGQVIQNGTDWVEFRAVVPFSVRDGYAPARLCAFGHGFFGKGRSVSGTGSALAADTLQAILIGIDWWGMSNDDETSVFADITSYPYRVMRFTDRVHQAMMNWTVVRSAFLNEMTELDVFKRAANLGDEGVVANPDGDGDNGGQLLYNDDALYFFGISQGHILGGTLAAVEPGIERYVLNVGGGGFSHMMFRAAPFKLFSEVIETFLTDDARKQRKLIATLMRLFDRIDSLIYAPYVLQNPLTGGIQDRHILMQTGVGDDQVPNVASYHHARAIGLDVTTPSPVVPWGLQEASDMPLASGLTIYDFGVDIEFYRIANNPDQDNGVHNGVSGVPAALSQIDAFLQPTGQVTHPCNEACDPD